MLRTNERADIRGRVATRTEAEFFRFCDAQCCERFADGFFNEKPLDGQTNLAAVRVAAPHGGAGRNVEVGIGENDHRVFAAKFENRWNQFLPARFHNTTPGYHASRE